MRAALYYGREDLRLEDVAEPETGPGDVKLRVLYAGICGSDLHEYYAGPVFTRADEPHPFSGVTNPVIIGHELCGEVVEVGPGVEGISEGELIAVEPVETCGQCEACLTGRRCTQYAIHGYTRTSGAFSEYTMIKERMAHKVPTRLGARTGALVEPMSVGMIAAKRAGLAAEQTAVLHGAGPIGIGVLLALRAWGVDVVVSDPSERRREAVRSLGVTHVLDPIDTDVVGAVKELTDGAGAAASIDAAGVPAALDAAIRSTAPDGRVVLVAVPLKPLEIDVGRFHQSRVFLTASTGTSPTPDAFREVIELMAAGHYPADGWTETIAFDDVVEEGFEALHRQEKVKVLIDVAGTA